MVKNRQFLWLAKLLYECHTMMTIVQKSIKMTHRMYFYTWVTFLTWSGRSIGRFVNLVKITKIRILAKISIFCRKFGFSPNYRGDLRMKHMVGNESLGCLRVLLEQFLISRYLLGDFWESWKKTTFFGIFGHFFSYHHHRPIEISITGRKSAKWFWDHRKDTLESFQTQGVAPIRRSHHPTLQNVTPPPKKKRDFRVFCM